jgi:hypothetical protein
VLQALRKSHPRPTVRQLGVGCLQKSIKLPKKLCILRAKHSASSPQKAQIAWRFLSFKTSLAPRFCGILAKPTGLFAQKQSNGGQFLQEILDRSHPECVPLAVQIPGEM